MFGTDATALRLISCSLIFPTQRSRGGNVGLEGETALRLKRRYPANRLEDLRPCERLLYLFVSFC